MFSLFNNFHAIISVFRDSLLFYFRAAQRDATVKCFIDNTQLFHEKTSMKLQKEKNIYIQSHRVSN